MKEAVQEHKFFQLAVSSRRAELLSIVGDALGAGVKGNVCEREAEVTRGPKTAKEFKWVKSVFDTSLQTWLFLS